MPTCSYIFSFYWAIVTFATLGYGDVTPSTTPEILYTILYGEPGNVIQCRTIGHAAGYLGQVAG
jgi:hypothetical protein